MSQKTKQRRMGGLTLTLYERTLHPELFTILRTDTVQRRAYEATIWLVDGGHVVRFTAIGKGGEETTFTEVVVNHAELLTDRNLIEAVPCRGEKYHETDLPGGVRYMISTQEEQLSGTLYEATKHEIAGYAAKRELMTAGIGSDGDFGPSMGVLDIECRANELLVQSFHLFDEQQLVVKTQGILEVLRTKA